jgi:predicted RNA-binding Zn-ribbon protein involved in translation (DUF1610 family)
MKKSYKANVPLAIGMVVGMGCGVLSLLAAGIIATGLNEPNSGVHKGDVIAYGVTGIVFLMIGLPCIWYYFRMRRRYAAADEGSQSVVRGEKIIMTRKQYFSVHCPYCGDQKLYKKSAGVVHCDNKNCPNGEKPVDIDRYNLRRLIFR